MTLTPSYVKSQYITLASQIRRALDEYDDPALLERTLVYRNLRTICENDNKVIMSTGVIAETICNILDTQAWLDFVDVDGKRKSCESFSAFIEKNGFDMKLAEFAIKEKRNDYHGKFLDAKNGELIDRVTFSTMQAATQPRSNGRFVAVKDASSTNGGRSTKKLTERWRQRLEKAAKSDEKAAELLERVIQRDLTITAVAEILGWHPTQLRKQSCWVIGQTASAAKPIIKQLGIAPEEFVKLALEEYLQNHYADQL